MAGSLERNSHVIPKASGGIGVRYRGQVLNFDNSGAVRVKRRAECDQGSDNFLPVIPSWPNPKVEIFGRADVTMRRHCMGADHKEVNFVCVEFC